MPSKKPDKPKRQVLGLRRISALRKRAEEAARIDWDNVPGGWSKCPADPMDILAVFEPLKIKDGLILRAYQYYEGIGGNAFVYAQPEDAPFPEPENPPDRKYRLSGPPVPPDVLDNYMEAIEGDGSLWSFFCASLLSRELGELGAFWHGGNWGTHTILFKEDFKNSWGDAPHTDSFTWEQPKPEEWRPTVIKDGDKLTVRFHTYSPLGQEAIVRYVDTFREGSYSFEAEEVPLAFGQGGMVF